MKKHFRIDLEDTIAAISTPIGEGAIGIVRISGRDAVKIADIIFRTKKDKLPSSFRSFTTHYGYVYDEGKIVDEALLTLMRAPKSYTKEDMVEISCHSGIVPLRKTLDSVLKNGARAAEPGEFTKRAFLNGRIDLAQAEAVLDIIRSKTDASLKVAIGQLKGELSVCLNKIKEELLTSLAHIEASIDFPDEDLEIISETNIKNKLEIVRDELSRLLESADAGIILREGIACVICGKPNVGKSSLLNVLLKKDRAIVTHIPGTTRDTIEEFANIDGIPFRLVDTAGIAPTEDIIEREGILRSREYLERSDLVLLVIDGNDYITDEDKMLLADTSDRPRIVVINKIDLPQVVDLNALGSTPLVRISAKYGDGIDELKKKMADIVWRGKVISSDGAVITNLRHKDALRCALKSVASAIEAIEDDLSPELIAIELKEALDSIGEIIGEIITDDLLDKIFSQFCIGK
ncbi:MAG: tRNA uridine-5-carboxymethylaminomethyl(34) synthesis GTPase MnmE [Candidatus Omnitrophota bacterium]